MLVVFAFSMLGIAMAANLPEWVPWFFVAISGMVFWMFLAMAGRDKLLLTAVLFTLPAFTAWRYQTHEQAISLDRLGNLASEAWSPVVVRGSIDSTPHWRPDLLRLGGDPQQADLSPDTAWQTLVELDVSAIRDHREWRHADFGRLQLAIQGRLRNLLPGDQVECMIDWQRITPPTNPGQFDLSAKYRRSSIFVRGRTDNAAQVRVIGDPARWRLDRYLSRIVIAADIAFHRYIPYQQATLASALVLGQREQVEWAMQESLLATGTIHMLAISGMHIEMVALSIVFACSVFRVPRRSMLLATMSIVVAYSLLCGGNPPVARAAILVVTLGIAKWIGKTSDSLNLLGFAAVAVLLYRPSHWLEIGTQLSFLAVAILILLQANQADEGGRDAKLDALLLASSHPITQGWACFWGYAYEILRTSLWVWLLTSPLVLYRFNVLSPIAVLLNFVLWIPMLLSLLSGLVLLVVGPMIPILAYPVGWICGVSLWLSEWVIQASEKIPMSHFWLPAPPAWWAIGFYLILFSMVGLFGFDKRVRRSAFVFACGWIAVGITPSLDRQFGPWIPGNRIHQADRLQVTFIDVGHGTSVLIQPPSGEVWLYDAGRLGDSQRSYLGIAGVLWSNRISRIDRMFLSHSDSDHFNAIVGLSKRFAMDRFITTQQALDSESRSLLAVFERLRKLRVPIELRHEGEVFEKGDTHCHFLHPPKHGVPGSDNANSLCLMLEFAGHRLLLPGDLEGEGTKRLVSKPRQEVSILMAPHHGSLSESPASILQWCSPTYAIISGGTKARNPKIRAAYSAQGRKALVTAIEHAIRCTIDQTGDLQIERWSHPNWVVWQEN
jgi:competence protein ComEC